MTGGRGVDLVQDNVGAATWRLVPCGSHPGVPFPPELPRFIIANCA
ncbi:MAG TPA: hypothetical protein VKY59_11795 [Spirillospora sp.]|nr:hypothetical protein [Spirillospora sp.]